MFNKKRPGKCAALVFANECFLSPEIRCSKYFSDSLDLLAQR